LIYRDPKCVHVADSLSEAEAAVDFLKGHGLPARIIDPATVGDPLGLTGTAGAGVPSPGLEVWVDDAANAAPALQKLQEFAADQTKKGADKETKGPVEAECEECGKTSTFPAAQRDSTQDCPHCGAYLDVPE
jgi:hypothetical protein